MGGKIDRKRRLSDYFWLMLKGIGMGTANKIPGVSGGTVAFIVGFYEEFVFSLGRFNKKSMLLLFRGKWSRFVEYTNLKFLGAIFLGTIISFFTVSLILDYLIRYFPTQVWGLFFGMVLTSLYYLVLDFKDWRVKTVVWLLVGIVMGGVLSFFDFGTGSRNLLWVFVCGMISVCGMTLPGLSGSFILLIIGNYKLLLVDSVNALYYTFKGLLTGDFAVLSDPDNMQLVVICVVFTLGSIAGLITLSHLLSYLLKRWHNIVTVLIIGFITGSLGIMWPWRRELYRVDGVVQTLASGAGDYKLVGYEKYLPDLSCWGTWTAIFWIVVGALTVFALEQYSRHLKAKKAGEIKK